MSAVEMGCQSSLFLLTGGPGTGKTFTASALLETLWKSLTDTSKEYFSIACAAPTGKAALTLQTAIANQLGQSPLKDRLSAKTLHALLGKKWDSLPYESVRTLPYDLLLIDEASMIDVELMARLLASVKSGARLIFVGDPHQLAPVDGPAIFPQLLLAHPSQVELTKCLRVESQALIDVSRAVQESGVIQPDGIHVKQLDIPSCDGKEFILSYAERFPLHLHGEDPEALLRKFQSFRILTPLRKGPWGSEQINQMLLQSFQKKGATVMPILITANDYQQELFNGEMGVLVAQRKKQNAPFTGEDQAYFLNGRKIPALLLPRFEWGYAMTIHKSQGSEFDEVLLLLPKETKTSKELLYTAVTRARKNLTIFVR
jgi:exodeoxyribonuclease V alpha subunit